MKQNKIPVDSATAFIRMLSPIPSSIPSYAGANCDKEKNINYTFNLTQLTFILALCTSFLSSKMKRIFYLIEAEVNTGQ